jgi:hypothetical protein
MQKTINITGGPSREELFDGLRLFAESREVSFLIVSNGRQVTLVGIIQSIQAEDGNGQSWNISMNVKTKEMLVLSLPVNAKDAISRKKIIPLNAYYSSNSRKGVFTIII